MSQLLFFLSGINMATFLLQAALGNAKLAAFAAFCCVVGLAAGQMHLRAKLDAARDKG